MLQPTTTSSARSGRKAWRRHAAISGAVLAVSLCPAVTQAASATWNATPTSDDWVTSGGDINWSTGADTFPGATTGTTNQDTATFLGSSTATIDINQPVNVKSLTFGATATTPAIYTIGAAGVNGGDALSLSHGGVILLASFGASGGGVQTINAPLILQPANATAAGTYTFTNSSANSSGSSFLMAGNISGGTTSGAITLILGGSNTAAVNTISGDISNGSAAQLNIEKTLFQGALWYLTGDNTFTGTVYIGTGTIQVDSINSVGGPNATATSSLGAPTTEANGTIRIGINSQSGTLKYVGDGETTNRILRLQSNVLSTIDSSGDGAVIFTSDLEYGATAGTVLPLSLNGTNTDENELAGVISNDGAGRVLSITKNGIGTWMLSGDNDFTGGVTVNTGLLILAHANAAGTNPNLRVGNAGIEARGGTRSFAGNLSLTGGTTTISGVGFTFGGALHNTGVNTVNIGDETVLTVNGDGGGISDTVNNRILTFTGGGTVNLNGSMANNSPAGTSTTSGITYSGTGSLTLAGNNTFTGNLTATNGRVYVSNTTGSGSGFGSVVVSGVGRLGGTGRIAPTVTGAGLSFANGTVLAPGDATGAGDLEIDLVDTTGVITLSTTATMRFHLDASGGSLAAPAPSSRLLLTNSAAGDLVLAAAGTGVSFGGPGTDGVFKLIDTDLAIADTGSDVYGNLTYDTGSGLVSTGLTAIDLPDGGTAAFYVGTAGNGGDVGDLYVEVAGVPEPSTLALLTLGAAGLLGRRRRKL